MNRTIPECRALAAQAHAEHRPNVFMSRTLADWEAAFIGICAPLPVKAQEPDDRLYEIAFKDGPLTPAEKAYLAAREELPEDAWSWAKEQTA